MVNRDHRFIGIEPEIIGNLPLRTLKRLPYSTIVVGKGLIGTDRFFCRERNCSVTEAELPSEVLNGIL